MLAFLRTVVRQISSLNIFALIGITVGFVFFCTLLNIFLFNEHLVVHIAGWPGGAILLLVYALVASLASVVHYLLFGREEPRKVRLRVTIVAGVVVWTLVDLGIAAYGTLRHPGVSENSGQLIYKDLKSGVETCVTTVCDPKCRMVSVACK
jgi:hypothetical protein